MSMDLVKIESLDVDLKLVKKILDLLGGSLLVKSEENDIKSSGYVVDTLEASLWSLLTTNSFKESILKAVNLGEDTDTIAAINGSMAGIIYGYKNIPNDWLNVLARREYIEELCVKFENTLEK